MRRKGLVLATVGSVFALQAIVISSSLLRGTGQALVRSALAATVLITVLALIDLAVARRLLRNLDVIGRAYANQAAYQLERSLQEYRRQAELSRQQAQSLGASIEQELAQARDALRSEDWLATNDHLRTGLDLAGTSQPAVANVTVAAVLANKERQYAEHGVGLASEVALPASLPFDDIHLAALLFNLLDNALHECQALQEADPGSAPRVQLRAIVQAGQLFIEVRNPCRTGASKRRRSAAQWRSSLSFHGLGTGIVETIAREYGGIAEFSEHAGTFSATVMLPVSTS